MYGRDRIRIALVRYGYSEGTHSIVREDIRRFVTIFLKYVAVIVFGLLLSEVQEAVAEALSASRDAGKVLTHTQAFLSEHHISSELSHRILRWVEFDHRIQHKWEREREMLQHMPLRARRLLLARIHRDFLENVPCIGQLRSLHREELLMDLHGCLYPCTFCRFQPIVGPDLHYVRHGVVQAEIQGALISTLSRGASIGADGLLSDNTEHHTTISGVPCEYVCESLVDCLVLPADSFREILATCPNDLREEMHHFQRQAHAHIAAVQQAIQKMGAEEFVNMARWWSLVHKMSPEMVLKVGSESFHILAQKMKHDVTGSFSGFRSHAAAKEWGNGEAHRSRGGGGGEGGGEGGGGGGAAAAAGGAGAGSGGGGGRMNDGSQGQEEVAEGEKRLDHYVRMGIEQPPPQGKEEGNSPAPRPPPFKAGAAVEGSPSAVMGAPRFNPMKAKAALHGNGALSEKKSTGCPADVVDREGGVLVMMGRGQRGRNIGGGCGGSGRGRGGREGLGGTGGGGRQGGEGEGRE